MEISFNHTIKRIPFDSDEEAQKVLDEITPLIGLGYYERNEKTNKGIFVIKSPMGDTVVHEVNYETFHNSQSVKQQIIAYYKAMVEAGLGDYIKK